MTDEKISQKLFENLNDKEKYKICTIKENGTIVLGKTSFKFWNQLLNCQDKLTFEAFALKVWDALVDASSGLNNEAILNGLSHEIVMNSVREKKYDWVVNRLFDCWRHVAQHSSGYQKPASPEGGSDRIQGSTKVITTAPEKPNIVINVAGEKRIIPIVDSIGDSFNIGLEFGITGVKKVF